MTPRNQGAEADLAATVEPAELPSPDPTHSDGAGTLRANLGCGQAYLDGWINVDASSEVRADVHLDAIDFVRRHGAECSEVYMGHLLEHLLPERALSLLRLIRMRLPAGARVSAVTPDMRLVFAAYERGEIDNRELNEDFVYSYVQPSHHAWCHDARSLAELFTVAGLTGVEPVDPLTWPPVFRKDGPDARYQCGVVATVPDRGGDGAVDDGELQPPADAETKHQLAGRATTISAEEQLLERIARMRQRMARLEARLREVQFERELVWNHASSLQRRLDGIEGSRTISLAMRAATLAVPAGSRRRALADRAFGGAARSRHGGGG